MQGAGLQGRVSDGVGAEAQAALPSLSHQGGVRSGRAFGWGTNECLCEEEDWDVLGPVAPLWSWVTDAGQRWGLLAQLRPQSLRIAGLGGRGPPPRPLPPLGGGQPGALPHSGASLAQALLWPDIPKPHKTLGGAVSRLPCQDAAP